MSIDTLLNDMDTVIEEGRSVPFSSKLAVDVDELRRIIEDIRLNMPVEITQAKKIAAERRDILNAADAQAEDIIIKARQRADLMVEELRTTLEVVPEDPEIASGEPFSIVENFEGDLEESGEKSLVASNTLPKCTLFKAGHHGSDTANTTTLLS